MAKVDHKKKINGIMQGNTITMSDKNRDGTPIVDDDDVQYARNFVNENKK